MAAPLPHLPPGRVPCLALREDVGEEFGACCPDNSQSAFL